MSLPETKALLPALSQQASHVFAPLQREIDRAFANFGRGFVALDPFGPTASMDLCETKDGLELSIELPGLKVDEIHVDLNGDVLTVSGEKRSQVDDKTRNYHFVERRYGGFSRSVTLPPGVRPEQIQATLRDGILKVTAPAPKRDAARAIKIQTPSS